LRVESAKGELGAMAESDYPFCFWSCALLFLSSIECVGIVIFTQGREVADGLRAAKQIALADALEIKCEAQTPVRAAQLNR
jgi:hypothetical protein